MDVERTLPIVMNMWGIITDCLLFQIQVIMVTHMKTNVFWISAPFSLVENNIRFRDEYCLHHQGDERGCMYFYL
jgi:hypothetical protein